MSASPAFITEYIYVSSRFFSLPCDMASALLTSGYPPVSPPVLQHPVGFFHLLGFVLVVNSLLLQPGFLFLFFWVFFNLPIQLCSCPQKTCRLLNFLAAQQQSCPHSSVVTSRVTQDALEGTNSASLDNPCCFWSSWSFMYC